MPNYLISPKDIYSAIDDNGNPLVGGQLFTYIAGSSTLADTFTNASGNTKNANPIILDSRGEAPVWLDDTMVYKFVLRQPVSEGGGVIRTTDNISANNGGGGVGISFVTHADSDTITLDGLGTAGSPLTANALISSLSTNALSITSGGSGGLYITDLSSAIATLSINKLDKVNTAPQSVVSPVTFNDTIILNSTADETPIKALGRNASNEVVEFTPTDDGENNTSSNVGTGAGLALPKVGVDLPFKSLVAGANTNIVENAEDITISSSGTTAGISSKVYFTADLDPVNVTWYQLSDTGKGITPSAEQTVLLAPDTNATFTEYYISGEYGFVGEVAGGDYEMQLVFEVDNNSGNQRFEAEFELVDADGVSNVVSLSTLDSGVLDIQANNPTQVKLTGNLPTSVPHSATQRVRVMVRAYKVGGSNNTTFSLWSGTDYESYIEVPVSITSDAVTDLSTVNSGGTQTQTNNLLDANKLDKVDLTAQSVASEVTFQSGVDITGTLADSSAVRLPDGSWIRPQTAQDSLYLTNGANPDTLNSTLWLTNNKTLLTAGDGVNELGRVDITNNDIQIRHKKSNLEKDALILGDEEISLRSSTGRGIYLTPTNLEISNTTSNIGLNSTGIRLNGLNGGYEFLNVPTGTPTYTYAENSSGDLIKFVDGATATPTLQQVTDVGSVTTNGATFGGRILQGSVTDDNTTGIIAKSLKVEGNGTFDGVIYGKKGLQLTNSESYPLQIDGDVFSVDPLIRGIRILTHSNSNAYYDHKLLTGGKIIFRVGSGTQAGFTNNFMVVDGATGDTSFTRILQGSVSDDGSTGIQGTTAKFSGAITGNSTTGVAVLNGTSHGLVLDGYDTWRSAIRFNQTGANPIGWNVGCYGGFNEFIIGIEGVGNVIAIDSALNTVFNGSIDANGLRITGAPISNPSFTTTQKNALTNLTGGEQVFDSTLKKMCFYNGTAWETITSV